MAVKNVVQAGNEILRNKSSLVDLNQLPDIQSLIDDMIETMEAAKLVGLAAPQIGENLRIFVAKDVRSRDEKNKPDVNILTFINPEIVSASKETVVDYEGCGSVANGNFFGQVKRSSEVIAMALDREGKKFEIPSGGLLARIILHENDHIEGILFTDKIEDWEKIMSREEYLKMREG
ncbi:peptide deformylase [Candidatus Dojkabacteria bacterium]|nr:peptide deformylase [Candidatus Dojkabacteria bacterium]